MQNSEKIIPEKESAYPEVYMFGDTLSAYGVYARHVQGFQISSLSLTLAKPDIRPPSNCEDVTGQNFTDQNILIRPN